MLRGAAASLLLPLLLLLCCAAPARGGYALPAADIALNSTEGTRLLANASHAAPFYQLINHFVTQANQAFCSVATAVTMLNALGAYGLPAPTAPALSPFAYHTQEGLFGSACVRSVPTHLQGATLDARFVASHGATLDEWAGYLSCFANVTATHAGTSDLPRFRAAALAAFATSPPAMVGINFLRTPLGELGGGHMSPLAAYERGSDRFLMLDVSRYKYPPVWVPAATLFQAMNTVDSDSGLTRGWVVVSVPRDVRALPPLPPPPPPVNNTAIRLCLAALPTDDGDAVSACIRGGAAASRAAAMPPPPPAQACAPAGGGDDAAKSGGGGEGSSAATAWVLVLILAMAVTVLGLMLRQERRAARSGSGGGTQQRSTDEQELLPR